MKTKQKNSNTTLTDRSYEKYFVTDIQAAERSFNALSREEKQELVLSTPWAQRKKLIELAQDAQELVQSLPVEEVYWTLKEIGPEDALPILSRASFEQLQYILDIECWKKDWIDVASVKKWLRLMLRCRESYVLDWLTKTDEPFLICIFKKLFTVFKLSDDIDLAEAKDLLPSWTLDGVYYFQFADEDTRLLAIPFLHLIHQANSSYFYYIMESCIWGLEAELQEDMLHIRQSRVADKGFPELEEALQVYQYMAVEEIEFYLKEKGLEHWMKRGAAGTHPRLRYCFAGEKRGLYFNQILALVDSRQTMECMQQEIINIANKTMIADSLDVTEVKDMERSLSKVMGYVNIATELLSRHNPDDAKKLIESVPMHFLFRVGYSQALNLRDRAKRKKRDVWFKQSEMRAQFYDSPWGDALVGLERLRPVFFEGTKGEGGVSYREFERLEEIQETERILAMVEIIEQVLFDHFKINLSHLQEHIIPETTIQDKSAITARCVFLTIMAQHMLHGTTRLAPLSTDELRKFMSSIFTIPADRDDSPGILKKELCNDTMSWITSQYTINEEYKPALSAVIQSCLELLRDECGSLVRKKEIDTRYISAVLIKKEA